jgi:DNA adenine methylase
MPRASRSPFRTADDVTFLRPFVKWAGGKSQLLQQYRPLYPGQNQVGRYLEPFLGGGAVFFHIMRLLRPSQALLWDTNAELIDAFRAVRDEIDPLIARLRQHRQQHSETYYYQVRTESPQTRVERAARLIYLNKTGFNGLYRVNSRGIFNVPYGHRANPLILDEQLLHAVSKVLQKAELEARDFRDLSATARKGDFIYFDPPYQPLSQTSHFTSYTSDSFGEKDQRDLANLYAELDRRGCLLMLSNSDTPLVRELYAGFRLHVVSARRMINSDGAKRGPVPEVVVLNYEAPGEEPREIPASHPTKIHTRTGDRGQTQLPDGQNLAKDALRMECLGAVDELSACIGLGRTLLQDPAAPAGAARLDLRMGRIQNELSSLCADLAAPAKRIAARHVAGLERIIDVWTKNLPPLDGFILPGGGPAAACLHLARTVCRRAERQVVRLAAEQPLGSAIVPYLNRLSDALFVAARHATQLYGHQDVLTAKR